MLTLLEGLEFVKKFQRGTACFVKFKDGVMSSKKGNVEVGVKVDQDLNCVCDFQSLHQAVVNADDEYTITFMEGEGKLKLSCESLTAEIEASSWEESTMSPAQPDQAVGPIDDVLKVAFKSLLPTLKTNPKAKGHAKSYETSIRIDGGNSIAASKAIYTEYWHGNNMPSNLFVDMVAADFVCKHKAPLVEFGFSDLSVTFIFANGEFVISKFSETAAEEFPTWERLNPVEIEANIDVPSNFVKECLKFNKISGKDVLFINKFEIRPSNYHEVDTFLKTEIAVDGFIVSTNVLKALVSPEKMGIDLEGGKATFYGGVSRSTIALEIQEDTRDEVINDDGNAI